MVGSASANLSPLREPQYVAPEPRPAAKPETPAPFRETVRAAEPLPVDPRVVPEVISPDEVDQREKDEKENFKELVERLNDTARDLGHRLSFDIYEGTEEFYAKVIDRRTNGVLRLIPSEEVLELHRKLQDAIGAVVDKKV